MLKIPTEKTPRLPTTPNDTSPIEKNPMPRPLEQLMMPAVAVPAAKYPDAAVPPRTSQGRLGAAAPPLTMSTSNIASEATAKIFAHMGRAGVGPRDCAAGASTSLSCSAPGCVWDSILFFLDGAAGVPGV